MRALRYLALPGLTAGSPPFELRIYAELLQLEIPSISRGPDLATAIDAALERWLDQQPELKRTWDCQWSFTSAASLEAFLARLGEPMAEPTRVSQEPPSLPAGDRQLRLTGGPRGNRVEIARAGDVITSVGLVDDSDRPWDVVAQRGGDLDALIAHWKRTFPTIEEGSAPRAYAMALNRARADVLWVHYRRRGIDGGETRRLLVLPSRAAVETCGPRRTLQVFATEAEALAKIARTDVACGLSPPSAAELSTIASAAFHTARKAKAVAANATMAARLNEAFRRLDAHGLLARPRMRGTRAEAWSEVHAERLATLRGAVFFLAEHERAKRAELNLYWEAWTDPDVARQIMDVLHAVGLVASAPRDANESIKVTRPR